MRTTPFSRLNPQFNRRAFERGLGRAGVGYLFLGVDLGGWHEGDEFYDEGHVLYGRMVGSPLFESGLAWLVDEAEWSRRPSLCREEDPVDWHHFLLITRVFYYRGMEVTHIHGDGIVQRTEEVPIFTRWPQPERGQRFFEGLMTSSWRSTRPGPGKA